MVRCWQGQVGIIASPVVAGRAAVLRLIEGRGREAWVWWRWFPVVALGVAGWGPVKLGLSWWQGGRGVLEGLTTGLLHRQGRSVQLISIKLTNGSLALTYVVHVLQGEADESFQGQCGDLLLLVCLYSHCLP